MNRVKKFLVVWFLKKSSSTSRTSAPFLAIKETKAGSLDFPRCGTGAKYGASVSTKILSLGISLKVFANSSDFLKVITPLAEIKAPKSNKSKANLFEPVKQWMSNLKSPSFLWLLIISNVSFSADLVWTIKGIFFSLAAFICSSKDLIWSFFSEWL